MCGAAFDAFTRKIVGGREAEGAVGNDANADAQRFGIGGAANLAILRAQRTVALVNNARLSQLRSA